MTLTKLKELAKNATPGPWHEQHEIAYGVDIEDSNGDWLAQSNKVCVGANQATKNAQYIAAANPETILKLIESVEEMERALDAYNIHPKKSDDWDLACRVLDAHKERFGDE